MKIPAHTKIANLLLAAFSGGIYLNGSFGKNLLWVQLLLGIIWIVTIFCYLKKSDKTLAVMLVLFFLLGNLRMQQAAFIAENDICHWTNIILELSGRIDEIPQVEEIDTSTVRIKGVLEILDAKKNDQSVNTRGKVNFSILADKGHPVCHWGDTVRLKGEIMALHAYHNPGLFDVEALKARQGIGAFCKGRKNALVIAETGSAWKLWIEEKRSEVLARMQQVMPKTDAAALFAMLFGGYGGIRAELIAAFSATGIIHILSVSGSHVTLLAGTVQAFARSFRFPPPLTIGMTVTAVGGYALFSGFCPPVVRSSLMGILAFVALGCQRQSDARYLLSAVALGMLAVSPGLLYDLSFQLSFGATAGLLYIAPAIRGRLKFLPGWAAENLAVTTAAQAAVLPFLAWYFNQLPVCSLLANLVAVPIIEWVILVGLAGAVIGTGLERVGGLFFILCSLGVGTVYSIAAKIAQIPFGNLFLPSGGLGIGCLYYLLLFRFCGFLEWWKTKMAVLKQRKMIASLFFCLFFIGVGLNTWDRKPFEAHFIDVGQGDAAVFITPGRQAVVIDTGGSRRETAASFDVGERVVVPYLRHLGIRKIRYMLLTHAHEDHAGGAAAILRHFPVDHIIVGREDQAAYQKVLCQGPKRCPLLIPAYAGQKFLLDGVEFEVVHAAESCRNSSGNETSNVFSIRYGNVRFLITGDLTAEGEKAMLEERDDLHCSVLKIAHHGSKTSSTEAFLDAAAPKAAVISVGAGNSFGHPSLQVLKRLEERHIPVWRTDVHGAIVVKCSRKELSFIPYRKEERIGENGL